MKKEELLSLYNTELFSMVRLLPYGLQERTSLFLMKFGGASEVHKPYNFFTRYFTPSWSWLFWILNQAESITEEELKDLVRAHAAALLCHHLDDNLVDHQTIPDILVIHLRTVAWNEFFRIQNAFSDSREDLKQTVRNQMESYFEVMIQNEKPEDLDSFLNVTRRHAGTWCVIPTIALAHFFPDRDFPVMQEIMEEFYLSMRFADDIQDIHDDATEGVFSGAYYFLVEDRRDLWEQCRNASAEDPCRKELDLVVEHTDLKRKLARVSRNHLENAAALARRIDLNGLAEDLLQVDYYETRGFL